MNDPLGKEARQRRLEAGRRLASRYDTLGPEELGAGQTWSFDEKQTALFLGTYSDEGIRRVVEHYGLVDLLAARGIAAFDVEIDTSDPFLHVLRLRERGGEVFTELRARVAQGGDIGLTGRLAALACFVVEWLSIEDPRRTFERTRPPLPGQRRPGLGIGPEVEEVLVLSARRVGAAALVSSPQWFHNAWLYHPRWRFVDPQEEGRFAALRRDLQAFGLPRLAWAVHLGCVRDLQGNVFVWQPGPLMLPRTRDAERNFEAPIYRAMRLAAKTGSGYEVDEAALAVALAERGIELP